MFCANFGEGGGRPFVAYPHRHKCSPSPEFPPPHPAPVLPHGKGENSLASLPKVREILVPFFPCPLRFP